MSEKDYNPNMHTLEHILNGTISRMFGCGRAFSTHIERKKSKIDYRFDRALTPEEIATVESEVNRVVLADTVVTEENMPIAQAKEIFDLSRLPEGVDGDLRIIRVGNYDSCPCIGSHVGRTSEIGGTLRIVSANYNPETGVMRVIFKINKEE